MARPLFPAVEDPVEDPVEGRVNSVVSNHKSFLGRPALSKALIFGIVVALSAVSSIRQMKLYNTQYRIGSFDGDLPSSFDSKTTQTVAEQDARPETTTTEKAGSSDDKAANKMISRNHSSEQSTTTEDEIANKTISHSSESSTSTLEEEFRNPPVSNNTHARTPIEKEAEGNANANEKDGDEEIPAFKRYDKVVIVTKIHGPHQWKLLLQSTCLLHFAYNHKVLYDIVVFTALEIPKEDIEALEKMVAPAKISIFMDSMSFQEEVAALTPAKYERLLQRCNVTNSVNLSWWSMCPGRLAYNWQAEFRGFRIWKHPALEKYKYMMWLDSDGFASKPWKNDPVGYFIENKGVIMFDNFPMGSTRAIDDKIKIVESFNDTTVCDLKLGKNGHLERKLINKRELLEGNCSDSRVPMIHGFMHITDLDFYRQPKVIDGLEALLGDCFACRSPDDQLAVTIPAAIYAPEKSWDMRAHGFDLKVYHNAQLDGKEKAAPPGFIKYWEEVAAKDFPSAANVCEINQRN